MPEPATDPDDQDVAHGELVPVVPSSCFQVNADSRSRTDATGADISGGDDRNTADYPVGGGDHGTSGTGLHVAALIEA
jgi:hypothetical protein